MACITCGDKLERWQIECTNLNIEGIKFKQEIKDANRIINNLRDETGYLRNETAVYRNRMQENAALAKKFKADADAAAEKLQSMETALQYREETIATYQAELEMLKAELARRPMPRRSARLAQI